MSANLRQRKRQNLPTPAAQLPAAQPRRPVGVKATKAPVVASRPQAPRTPLRQDGVPNPQARLSPVHPLKTGPSGHLISNHYLDTLLDPAHVTGVKIPDIDFSESGTVHIRQVVQADSGTYGLIGLALGGAIGPATFTSLLPSETTCDFGNSPTTTTVIGALVGSSAVVASPFAVSVGPTGVGAVRLAGAQVAMLEQIFTDYRLVSASVTAECASSYANLQGYVLAGSFPKSSLYDVPLSNMSVTDLLNSPYTESHAVSRGPLQARYMPTDETCFDYQDINRIYSSTELARKEDLGCIMALFYGLPSSQPVQFTFCLNYEYLPKYGSIALGVSPSPVDRDAVDAAINYLQTSDPVGPTTPSGMIAASEATFSSNDVQFVLGSNVGKLNAVRRATTPKVRGPDGPPAVQSRGDTVPQRSILAQMGDFMLKVARKAAPALVTGILGLL